MRQRNRCVECGGEISERRKIIADSRGRAVLYCGDVCRMRAKWTRQNERRRELAAAGK